MCSPQRVLMSDLPEIKKTAGSYDFTKEVLIYTIGKDKKSYNFLMVLSFSDLLEKDFENYCIDVFSEDQKIFVPRSCGKNRFDLRVESQKDFNEILKHYVDGLSLGVSKNAELVLEQNT